jgi:protein-S-isoprenylcysteine O-methyltransferase Ste14
MTMDDSATDEQTQQQSRTVWGLVKRLLLACFSTLVQAALIFIPAWRLDWPMAWVTVAVYGISAIGIVFFLKPELVSERAKIKPDAKTWDRILANFLQVLFLALPVVGGLDMRLGWTDYVPVAGQIAGIILFALGFFLVGWATVSNRFFSNVVRIQFDRGHTVVSDGPYQFVRHPGYVGMLLYLVAIPLALNSLWALVPGGLGVILTIVRTALEDKTLREELEGYADYVQRTRYRLIPGIW